MGGLAQVSSAYQNYLCEGERETHMSRFPFLSPSQRRSFSGDCFLWVLAREMWVLTRERLGQVQSIGSKLSFRNIIIKSHVNRCPTSQSISKDAPDW